MVTKISQQILLHVKEKVDILHFFMPYNLQEMEYMKLFSILSFFLFSFVISCEESKYSGPLTPKEALESFHINENFELKLFASEPNVKEPVEMVFDENGNIFVIEMPDYPFKPDSTEANGRIRILTDTNNDGRIDHSTIFAEGLAGATSILPWKSGLLVTAAPYIFYLKDTTGDFKADTKEIIFSGFSDSNVAAQITSLRYSIDNWIYAANFGQPGNVIFHRKPDQPPLNMAGADLRFRLDRNKAELATAPAQFGQTFNEWGDRFITHNTKHIRQAVIPMRYLRRHDHLSSTNGVQNIYARTDTRMYQLTPAPYWRAERSRRRQEEFEKQGSGRIEHPKGYITGASGGTIYLGDAYSEEYYGNLFTGETAGNLVMRNILTSPNNGSGSPIYTASRPESELDQEFLASTDPWFRPVSFTVGPDGFLYLVDMYRQHIEAAFAIPKDLLEDMNYANGADHGRIYRIVQKAGSSSDRISPDLIDMPSLGSKESSELIGYLSHPNRWWRLQAQRLLLERQDHSIVTQAEELMTGHQDPKTRLHALYVLEGLDALNARLIEQAMKDKQPGVRKHGMILSEEYPDLLPKLVEGTSDPAVRAAFQATLSVGEFSGPQVVSALADVVERHGEDQWFRTAVLSSEPGSSVEILQELIGRNFFGEEARSWKQALLEEISFAVGSRNIESEVASFLELLRSKSGSSGQQRQLAAIEGLIEGLRKQEEPAGALREVLIQIEERSAETDPDLQKMLELLWEIYSDQ